MDCPELGESPTFGEVQGDKKESVFALENQSEELKKYKKELIVKNVQMKSVIVKDLADIKRDLEKHRKLARKVSELE